MSAMATVARVVAREFGILPTSLTMRSNSHAVVLPRQVAQMLCRECCGASLQRIGNTFRQHHTTVLNSLERIEKLCAEDSALRDRVERLALDVRSELLRAALPAAVPLIEALSLEASEGWERVPSSPGAAKPSKGDGISGWKHLVKVTSPRRPCRRVTAEVIPEQAGSPMRRALAFDEADAPAAGTACTWCLERGHFCSAKGVDGGTPLCRGCGMSQVCPRDLAIQRMRVDVAAAEWAWMGATGKTKAVA